MSRKFLIALTLITLPALAQAEEAAKDSKVPKPKEVSSGMAEVWCEKMKECAKDKSMGPMECKKILYKSFMTGFENAAKAQQKVEITPQNYEECVKNVKAQTCDTLKTTQTLPGCEFIALISKPI